MDMQSIVRDVLALNLDEKGKKLRSCDVISAFPRDEFPQVAVPGMRTSIILALFKDYLHRTPGGSHRFGNHGCECALFWVGGLFLMPCIDSKVALNPGSRAMIRVRMGLAAGFGGDDLCFLVFSHDQTNENTGHVGTYFVFALRAGMWKCL
jgi:hypothetical protein